MSYMTTAGTPQMSDYSGRMFEIHVSGVCNQDVARVSTYTTKVPQSRMNQAIQEISRLGGKVTGINVLPAVGEQTESEE